MASAESDYLLRLASLSLSLVGFSAIVVTLRGALGGELSDRHLRLVRLYIEGGFIVTALALVPTLLNLLHVPDSLTWPLSSAIAASIFTVVLVVQFRRRRSVEPGPFPAWVITIYAVSIAAVAGGLVVMWRRRQVAEPNYLEGAYFCLLIALLSPQGWDYVLVIGMPAYMLLVDRFRDLSLPWRAVTVVGIFLTSFTIWDLVRRTLYAYLMAVSAVSIGAILIAACLIHLRWRALA